MNPYNVDTSDSSIRGPIVSLNILYDEMPRTSGCEKCHEVNGDDAAWCCRTMSPSMYYIEFLNVWKDVQKWSKEKKTKVIVKSIKNHLIGDLNKGCVFWDNQCSAYDNRPLACRLYAVIPEEGWDARVKTLKSRYGEDLKIRPQCNLVTPEKPITKQDEDKWFNHTSKCESRIGVSQQVINAHDDPNGSYRTFHDHILMELFEEDFLTQLSTLRLTNPSAQAVDEFVAVLMSYLENKIV